MRLLLAATFAFLPAAGARAGTALAGMGGTGVGLADPAGELGDNPAALGASGVGFDEGRLTLGASWTRLTFAGSAYNATSTVAQAFDVVAPGGLTYLSPRLGPGRIAAGVWQMDGRSLFLDEPLDLALAPPSSTVATLAATYEAGAARLRQREALSAAGAAWILPLEGGVAQIALGGAAVSLLERGTVTADGVRADTGDTDALFRAAARRSYTGAAVLAGFFYRPVPDGSVGVAVTHLGEMAGSVWEQAEGGALRRAAVARPAQTRVALGGGVTILEKFRLAGDFIYLTEIDRTERLFAGTPAERTERRQADVAIEARLGAEYPVRVGGETFPLRAGFFLKPDPLPAAAPETAPASVADLTPAAFRQDLTAWTLGAGWERGGLRVDLGFRWLLVTTHVRRRAAAGAVDSGDTRASLGATASLTLALPGRDRMSPRERGP